MGVLKFPLCYDIYHNVTTIKSIKNKIYMNALLLIISKKFEQQLFCTHHKNVENYNNLIFQRLFMSNETLDVILYYSASKFQRMQHWIKRSPILNI
jgi:hypothetical protein